jgi:5-(carboxyamino)imidazole ribonucleotide mutase
MSLISIISGSASDEQIVEKTTRVLDEAGIDYDYQILSAHRNPDELDEYVKNSDSLVFICIAGLSAALPGVVASKTDKPVIGVPVSGTLGGLDALLSIVQMPRGVPVGCVGIDNGANAAHLAVKILAVAGKI